MGLDFITLHTDSVNLNSPLKGKKNKFYIEAFCENEQVSLPSDEAPLINHWWDRKWQVSLDYYLSSPSQKGNRQKELVQKTLKAIDIYLPSKIEKDKCSFIQALVERKTHRKYLETPLSLETFSTLLQNLEGELFKGIWNYYLVIFNVEQIPDGVYCYCPTRHGLTKIKTGKFREELVAILCGMSAPLSAAFTLIFSIDLKTAQETLPYERALREIYIDSGRLSQKLIMKGMQHHIGALPTPAMRDSYMCEFLNIDPEELIPLYTLTMGIIPEKRPA